MKKEFKKRLRLPFKILLFKQKKLSLTSKLYLLGIQNIKNQFYHQLNFKLCPNNIFGSFKNILTNKILYNISTGMIKLKTTKKKLKFNLKIFLFSFFKKVVKRLKTNLIVNIIAPKIYKKLILKQIQKYIKNQRFLLINIDPRKIFNGCRPSKKIKKKRRLIRYIK